jgi:hypothetical protein
MALRGIMDTRRFAPPDIPQWSALLVKMKLA